MKITKYLFFAISITLISCTDKKNAIDNTTPICISGIYPQLAYYNNEGECGTGAVVPFGDKLWVITYGPHLPNGSSDKLYEISHDLKRVIRDESIGGTPANRMIHKESNQLFIGPYVIKEDGSVRVIPYSIMPGRHTGNARHLTDPAGKIYYGTMEEGFYEVDVNSLAVKELYPDGNNRKGKEKDTDAGPQNDLLPGVHGKGLYSGQGVMVYSNNGEGTQEALKKFDVEAGVLAEWNGKDWKVVRRNQFTEISGPGGIYGNANPETDQIWATGWDYKSVLIGVRDATKGWSFYRLPKASHSYDGAHGWNTEWPRIRNIGTKESPDYLMTMHGMFWHFPGSFSSNNSAGIHPRSAYLKVIGDFARWNIVSPDGIEQDVLVFGCDDAAKSEFLNKRAAKGAIEGAGQSNSNLWFTSLSKPDELGPTTAEGAVWAKESVKGNEYSEPFLFSGWPLRCGWIKNEGTQNVTYTFEVDESGNNTWKELKKIEVESGKSVFVPFSATEKGEWIRVKTNKQTTTTVSFNYATNDNRPTSPNEIFNGLAKVESKNSLGGLLYDLPNNRRKMGLLATTVTNGAQSETGYYELGDKFDLIKIDNDTSKTAELIRTKMTIPKNVYTVDEASALIIDDAGHRWRLPVANESFTSLMEKGEIRICREVMTERDIFNCMGTFFELPAENADGYAKIRPIATNPFRINDYVSYRGMLIMSGIVPNEGKGNPHIIVSDDGKAAIWAGVIDDLWQMGKPVGHGGPWKESEVSAGIPSDAYLIAFYDEKTLTLSHNANKDVNFTVEVDPTGNGDWMTYSTFTVKKGESLVQMLPKEFQARWIRFYTDSNVKATAWLDYK